MTRSPAMSRPAPSRPAPVTACPQRPLRLTLTLCALILCASGCEVAGEAPDPVIVCHPLATTSTTALTGDLGQDILGDWLSEETASALSFSPNGRWREHDPHRHTLRAHGTYTTSTDGLLTMRAGPHQRRERAEVLPDRLIVWISDSGGDRLTYLRARCVSPSTLTGAAP